MVIVHMFYAFLSNLGSELLVLLFSEMAVRFIIPLRTKRSDQLRVCVIQGCILAISTLFLHLFHHKPFLLLLVTIILFLQFLSTYAREPEEETQKVHVSKRLPNTMNRAGGAEPMQWSPTEWADTVASGNTSQPATQWPQSNTHVRITLAPAPVVRNGGKAQYRHRSVGHSLNSDHPSSSVHNARPSMRSLRTASQAFGPNELSRGPLKGSPTKGTSYPFLKYVSTFWDKPKPSRCPPGILNTGNICFISSTLHSLTWTPGFLDKLRTVCRPKEQSDSPVSAKLQLLRSLYTVLDKCHVLSDSLKSYSTVDSSPFLNKVSESVPYLVTPTHRSYGQTQQDASEFLLWLLDNLHGDEESPKSHESTDDFKSAQQKKEKCFLQLKGASSHDIPRCRGIFTELAQTDWILQSTEASCLTRELFLGQIMEARECQNCRKMSVNVEYFTVLPLPIPNFDSDSGTLSLTDCFGSFSAAENLTSSNMMVCSCSPHGSNGQDEAVLTPGVRLAMLSRPPKRMVIQLTRFSYNTTYKSAQKNTLPILLPTTLDISPYLMEHKLISNGSSSEKPKTKEYSLYAVCIHTGAQSTSYGHYLAYCRASNGVWYCYNDSYVSVIEDMERELQTPVLLQNAYLLLYTAIERQNL